MQMFAVLRSVRIRSSFRLHLVLEGRVRAISILGHSTYGMVMRYVHLDKGDLARDVDLRSPF